MTKLIEYIHRHREKGYDDQRIRKAMHDHGIREERIEHAFKAADEPKQTNASKQTSTKSAEPRKKSKSTYYLITSIIVIFLSGLSVIGFSIYWLMNSEQCVLPGGLECASKTKEGKMVITVENTLETDMQSATLKMRNDCAPSSVTIPIKKKQMFTCTDASAAKELSILLSFNAGYAQEVEGMIMRG